MIKTKCVYDKKEPDDGKWILVDREYPKNLPKDKIDEHCPDLAPSPDLSNELIKKTLMWEECAEKYLNEVVKRKESIETLDKRKQKREVFTFVTSKSHPYFGHDILLCVLMDEGIRLLKLNEFKVYATLAYLFYITRNNLKCLRYLDKIIRLGLTSDNDWFVNAILYLMDLGPYHYEKDKVCFNESIKFNQTGIEVSYRRGLTLLFLLRYDESLKYFEKVISLEQDNVLGWYNQGCAFFFKSDYKSAKIRFEKTQGLVTDELVHKKEYRYLKTSCIAMSHFASAMDKLSELLMKKTIQERVGILEECEKSFGISAKYFKKIGNVFLTRSLLILLKITSFDCKFTQCLDKDLSSFKKDVDKIISDFKKLNVRDIDIIAADILKGKVFYFLAVKNALELKEVDTSMLNSAKVFLENLGFKGQEEMIAKFKQFIVLLDDYRKRSYTNIGEIPKAERDNLMKLIRPSANYANGVSTQEAFAETIKQMCTLFSQHSQEARFHFKKEDIFQQQVVKYHEKIQEVLGKLQPQPESEKPKKEKIEVNFTESDIRISGRAPQNKDYPWILVENIILKERLHWLWGFVYLSSWTSGEMLENHPKKQFVNYFSKEFKNIKDYGFSIQHKRGENEWVINYDITASNIKCNLLESRSAYKDAVDWFGKDNISETIKRLELAITPFYYADINFIDAYKLLTRCILRKNFEDISENLLNKTERFLRWYKRRLRETIFVIQKIYIKNKILSEEEIKDEVEQMGVELEDVSRNYEAIKNRVSIPESAREFEEIINLVQNLREVIEEKVLHEGRVEDFIFGTEEFIALKNNKHIGVVINLAIERLAERIPELEEKSSEVDFMLFSIVQKGIDFEKNNTVAVIRKFLFNRFQEEIQRLVKGGKPLKEKLGFELDKIKDTRKGRRISPRNSKIDNEG